MVYVKKQKKTSKIKQLFELFFIISIFALFMFFRFYNFENRIAFGWDHEQYTFQVKQLLVDHKPVLLGPRTTNDRGFFLAPYFTYLIAPFFLITKLHPSAITVFLFIFNVLFFISTYLIISYIFSKKTATLFLLLWSINPLIAMYDFKAWWPIYIPLGTLVVIYLMKKIYEKNLLQHWILLGIFSGVLINMHVQFAFILFFIVILVLLKDNVFKNLKNKMIFVFYFLIMFLPLAIFDLRHDFLNLKLIINFFTNGIGTIEPYFYIWVPVFKNVIQPIIFTKNALALFIFYVLLIISLIFLIKHNKGFMKHFFLATLILWIVFPFIFGKYGQRPSEYYFMFLYPFIYIVLIEILRLYKKTVLLYIIAIILFLANYQLLVDNLKPDLYSLKFKDKLIRELDRQTKGKKFNISFTTSVGADSGFRYLINYYQIPQTGDFKDPLVQIKIPDENVCNIKVNYMGVIIPKELSN